MTIHHTKAVNLRKDTIFESNTQRSPWAKVVGRAVNLRKDTIFESNTQRLFPALFMESCCKSPQRYNF